MEPSPGEPNVPEPVLTVEWWKAAVLGAVTATSGITIAFNAWDPTQEQLVAISAAGTFLVLTIFPLVAFLVRKRVTPNENVAVTKVQAAQIAAQIADPWRDVHDFDPTEAGRSSEQAAALAAQFEPGSDVPEMPEHLR